MERMGCTSDCSAPYQLEVAITPFRMVLSQVTTFKTAGSNYELVQQIKKELDLRGARHT